MKAITTALLVFLLSTVLHTGYCERSLLKEEVIALKGEMTQLKVELQTFKNVFDAAIGQSVGFTVRAANIPTFGLTSPQIIKFDKIDSNEGNGYDAGTGTFTAPFPGTYVFFVQVMNQNNNEEVYLDIMKNSTLLSRAQAGYLPYESGASLAVTRLNEGDKVNVQVSHGNGFTGAQYTSFSGFSISLK